MTAIPMENAAVPEALAAVIAPVAKPAPEVRSAFATASLVAVSPAPESGRGGELLKAFLLKVLPPIFGLGLFLGLWSLVSMKTPTLPGPMLTLEAAIKLFADPFYRNGPNDQGIGWNILYSLQRVGIGFGIAAAVGIPVGFLIGRFAFLNGMLQPIISLLRPVSPLAWLPIGLLVFKAANPAAIWVIAVSAVWPMILNTAQGVQRVPQDYLNVARVLNLSEWKVFTKILCNYSPPPATSTKSGIFPWNRSVRAWVGVTPFFRQVDR